MPVLLFLSGCVNQTGVRRRVLRLELLNRFKIRCVANDFCKLLQLVELIRSCCGLLLFNNGGVHDNSSIFGLTRNYARIEDRQRQTRPRHCHVERSETSSYLNQIRIVVWLRNQLNLRHAKLNSKLAEVARSFAHAQDDSVPGLMGYADTAG